MCIKSQTVEARGKGGKTPRGAGRMQSHHILMFSAHRKNQLLPLGVMVAKVQLMAAVARVIRPPGVKQTPMISSEVNK